MPRRRRSRLAALGCSAALLAGCTGTAGEAAATDPVATPRPTSSTDTASATSAPTGSPGLARYYAQRLNWVACSSYQCARLAVPVDYANPDGASIQLAVLRARARSSTPIGSLVVNPGGPGASGVQYAAAADRIVSGAVRRSYHVVGFDPRGVGQSAPITCLDDRAMDGFLGADPTPDDATEQSALFADARRFALACQARNADLLGHVSTVDAAKDMDILRAALREPKLDYLGKSYGTFLGATYAELFPTRVGRFVLDGAIAPDLSAQQLNEGQAVGFEQATRNYVAACVKRSGCPLGSTVAAGMQRLRDLLASLDSAPIPMKDPRLDRLTEGWASLGIADAMYNEMRWDTLTQALTRAFRGDGTQLMALADEYAERDAKGRYQGNLLQVIYAVNCLDRAVSPDPPAFAAEAARLQALAPTWGRLLAWGSAVCSVWPVPATGKPQRIDAAGSGPIVVVGTTRDPATPYSAAVRLADELAQGRLVTYDGDGHTAYRRSNACVDRAVDGFLLTETLPAEGLRC
ncbi:MAG TPA: alpha/beta hydrolase [Dermatophilaceae bacterium]|nr:alpha/beta hydrolase [Dermatophilaceae bacterium]